MKIISKHKDYYDFLQGVNGIDEKVVLDRTTFYKKPYTPLEDTVITFFICGYQIDGVFKNGKFLYGKEVESFASEKDSIFAAEFDIKDYYFIGGSKYGYNYKILKKPKKIQGKNPNDLLKCPILIRDVYGKHISKGKEYSKFPILKDYDFVKVFSAEEIWIMLYNWLSKETPIENKQTDKEKIVSKGFDLKHSFRNTK